MSQGASGNPWKPKLTLENYLNLEQMDVIPFPILRKILMIHGFRSFNVPKDDLLDAVRSIELMDAHHSTLQSDAVSSNAFVSLNDVIKDLSLLHWHECCITSIETINSMTNFGSGSREDSSPKRFKHDCNTASSSKKITHEGNFLFLFQNWSPMAKSGKTTMTLPKENTENTPVQTTTSSVDTMFCTRKRSEEAGFMDNAKESKKSFFHASFDEHKACFKATWHRMIARFEQGKSAGLEGQNTVSSKN